LITSKTKLCCLVGDPVEHSMSPAMQNAAFRELGLDWVYVALRVPKERLGDAVRGLRAMGFAGANVTIPHKREVMRFLDEVDPLARQIGAVNTIVNRNGRLAGYNTDGEGALKAIAGEGIRLKGKRAVILGAGGAAHAIASTLAKKAGLESLLILNIVEGEARELAARVQAGSKARVEGLKLDRDTIAAAVAEADLVINATSVGMVPEPHDSLVPRGLLRKGLAVFDVVYNPLETRLVREAKAAGCKVVTGEKMLANQGAASFELWTGRKAPAKTMLSVLRQGLGAK
jgi:shikimate dehydrogenase